MRVLLIGQLPKEIGGNYTTGAANVVLELSKQKVSDVQYYTYGTNITSVAARKASLYQNQYIGYKFRPVRMFIRALCHPFETFNHLWHYRNIEHQNVFRYAFYEDNIREAIEHVKPDLIHVNSISNVSPVRFAIGKKNIPLILTCHGIFYRGDKTDIVNRDRFLGNIKLADAYTGLTIESLDEYEKILAIPKEQVSVIPNGVDCKKFYYSSEERRKIRMEYGASDSCKVFITVASIQERKGQLLFLKELSRLNIDFQYWIIGKGPDEENIHKFILENNLEEKVKLLGYKKSNELYKFYSAADIYAHPSWKEGQALSELEANATGLRTVVNKAIVGTIANDITSSDYYIIDFNKIDLKSFTQWILQEPQNRQSRTTFDWSKVAAKYGDLYKSIIEQWKK
mgnify:CR=1 FL=1